jgi:predicted O-linked N-acetylglucosamine transferase (SPINDLY family)
MTTIEQMIQQAMGHHLAGRRGEAEAIYRRALTLEPNNPAILIRLGALRLEQGAAPEAVELIDRATKLSPNMAQYHNALGTALTATRRLPEAAGAFRRAVQCNRDYADAHHGLGKALTHLGQLDEAIASLRTAANLKPTFPPIQTDLANALRRRGRLDEALAAARRAVEIDPRYAWGHNILGLLHCDRGENEQALASLNRAVALRPDMADAYVNLAQLMRTIGRFTEAINALSAAIKLRPGDPSARLNLGLMQSEIGAVPDAIATFREAIPLRPDAGELYGGLLMTLNYDASLTPQQRFEEHRSWGGRYGGPLSADALASSNDRSPRRRLRIGYVSADLRSHSVSWFIEPVLESHDRERFEVFCYADVLKPDAVTARLRGLPRIVWRDIAGMGDDAVARLVRDDRIDILVDLGGHTERNRLFVFARKPAPVQVTYLGYPNTTGLSTIDYRLTDACADPVRPNIDALYTEKLVRLPSSFLCYRPPPDAPPVVDGVGGAGTVTFASFNNLAKLSPPTIELWAKILNGYPGSKLLLKGRPFGDAPIARAMLDRFVAHGVAVERIELRPSVASTAGHLKIYNEVDVALDPFPYNGTTTTCEALWMGVPVVTLSGDTHAARVGDSILSGVGLSELVANSADRYLGIAVALASDPARRASLRSSMRQRLRSSPLLDAARITRDIEAACQSMWRNYVG